jgi:murein DD-endopeptidase MepM/ murein hydrolase activator NlpD
VGARNEAAKARAARRQLLRLTQVSRRRQESHLAALQREQRRVRAALRLAQTRLAPGLPAAVKAPGGRLALPVAGPLTSPFGPRWGRLHAGIDIAAPGGTPIRAAEAGRVVLAAATGGYGLYTCIQHTTSLSTCYAHQSRLGTRQGASVGRGEVMGYVGNTGNSFGDHLHFEVRVDGTPVDPAGYV